MIRKNAVESILAERNILISARNPFVVSINAKDCYCDFMEFSLTSVLDRQVRFFYSFTCRENLYLVMEYLNGGDLYSLLRSLGCLDEEMARTYIAEIVSYYYLRYLYTYALRKLDFLCIFIFQWPSSKNIFDAKTNFAMNGMITQCIIVYSMYK